MDNQPAAAPYQEEVKAAPVVAGVSTRKEVGRGRVVYVPGLEFDGPMPPPEPYFNIGPAFWKRPKNWQQLMDAVEWASRGDVPLRVDGPDFIGANLVEQIEKRRRIVHLVNYNRQAPSVNNIQVKCAVPAGQPASAVRLYSIESDAGSAVNFQMQDQQAMFTIPRLNTYGIVTVSW